MTFPDKGKEKTDSNESVFSILAFWNEEDITIYDYFLIRLGLPRKCMHLLPNHTKIYIIAQLYQVSVYRVKRAERLYLDKSIDYMITYVDKYFIDPLRIR